MNSLKLIIYGGGNKDFSRRYKRLNIENRNSHKQSELNKALSEMDIGIVPSIWEEIFGIVGIEFLAARIPVIGTAIGGIPDWLKDSENGFLVPATDATTLASIMQRFVAQPSLIAKIQSSIKPWKTIREHALEIISIYECLR